MIIAANTSAELVLTVTTAIKAHMAASAKLSKIILSVCALPSSVQTIEQKNEFIDELAQIFTTARQQGAAKLPDGDKSATKSFTNSWGYAMRIAGAQLGVKFQYAQHKGLFEVLPLVAPSPTSGTTASGKESGVNTDVHAANESAASMDDTKLPELPKEKDNSKVAKAARAARQQAANKAVRGLLKHGFTHAELATAFEAILASHAAREAGRLEAEMAAEMAKTPANTIAA